MTLSMLMLTSGQSLVWLSTSVSHVCWTGPKHPKLEVMGCVRGGGEEQCDVMLEGNVNHLKAGMQTMTIEDQYDWLIWIRASLLDCFRYEDLFKPAAAEEIVCPSIFRCGYTARLLM
jgi:hypothetical protein